jgi:hypothetical protein
MIAGVNCPEFPAKVFLVAVKEAVSTERKTRRRSLRIVMRVPLYVSPMGAPSTAEWEPVETVTISLHGGMIRTRQEFPVGTTLDIRMRSNQRATRGRVVWTAAGAKEFAFEIGFEILEPPGFWEIRFPEDRWSEESQSSSHRT